MKNTKQSKIEIVKGYCSVQSIAAGRGNHKPKVMAAGLTHKEAMEIYNNTDHKKYSQVYISND